MTTKVFPYDFTIESEESRSARLARRTPEEKAEADGFETADRDIQSLLTIEDRRRFVCRCKREYRANLVALDAPGGNEIALRLWGLGYYDRIVREEQLLDQITSTCLANGIALR
jgi:hypothetical protein